VEIGSINPGARQALGPFAPPAAIGPGMTKADAGLMLTPDGNPCVQSIVARSPIQARDTPDALCGALLLLVSDAGRWMTGQVLSVDGGWVMRT